MTQDNLQERINPYENSKNEKANAEIRILRYTSAVLVATVVFGSPFVFDYLAFAYFHNEEMSAIKSLINILTN